ncbi:MAG: hypothetical protein ACI9EW_001369 [Cellvibrionaceae bacterium]|jgi:hypothetical protein
MNKLKGSCLCGRVTYQVTADFAHFHMCHCTQCQKATGSAHASNLFTKAENFTWLSGAELVKRYDMPGRAISQAFCTECGSGLPFPSKSGSGMMVIPAGTLDDQPEMSPQDNIFWNERANWYEDGLSAEHFDQFPT